MHTICIWLITDEYAIYDETFLHSTQDTGCSWLCNTSHGASLLCVEAQLTTPIVVLCGNDILDDGHTCLSRHFK